MSFFDSTDRTYSCRVRHIHTTLLNGLFVLATADVLHRPSLLFFTSPSIDVVDDIASLVASDQSTSTTPSDSKNDSCSSGTSAPHMYAITVERLNAIRTQKKEKKMWPEF